MGSLISKPKSPPSPQVVYVPAPKPVADTITADTSSAETETPKTDDEIQAEAREQNLLRRTRGRLGTILTGFRGILSPASAAPARKSLLGE